MLRKCLFLIVALAMIFSLFACSPVPETATPEPEEQPSTTVTETPTPAPTLEKAEKHFNTGVELEEQGSLQDAIAEYDEAIRVNPEFAESYYNHGFAYQLQGKKAQAIADFEKYITVVDNPELVQRARQQIERLSK